MIKTNKKQTKKYHTQIHRTIPETFDQFRKMLSADFHRGKHMLIGDLLPGNDNNTFVRLSIAADCIGDINWDNWNAPAAPIDMAARVYRNALAGQGSAGVVFNVDREEIFWTDVKDELVDELVNVDVFRDFEQCNDFLQCLYDC